MTKRTSKKTTVAIPEPTSAEILASTAYLLYVQRPPVEFDYVDKQGVKSRRVAIFIRFHKTQAVMASLVRDEGELPLMQGGNRNFEVACISNVKMYVPSEKERPVAELGYRRILGELKALDAANETSRNAAEKRIARTVARETQAAADMQAAFEYNRALKAQIMVELGDPRVHDAAMNY